MRAAGLLESPNELELEAPDHDPVCGRTLLRDAPGTVRLVHHGQSFAFCSEACRERFERLAERVRVGEVLKMGALFAPSEKVRWGVA